MATNKYNPQSHFFVDHSALRAVPDQDTTNEATDAFGPVTSSPATQYRTTSFVRTTPENTTTPVKVFAICEGRVLIQPMTEIVDETLTVSTTKVNLILKPEASYAPIKIKYFIYRGINKADLLEGDSLIPINEQDTTQPDFLKNIWSVFKRFNNTSTSTDFSASLIGYDPSESPTTLIDEVFNRQEYTYQLPWCSADTHLGYFTGRIGLDIVLDEGDYQLEHQQELFKFDLGYARKDEHIFKISDISDPDPVIEAAYQARYKEYILRFIDAAAFWGSHIDCGEISLFSSGKVKTAESIYTNILNKYQTRHALYIHIMAERGRSYNYYDGPNNKRKVSFELLPLSPVNLTNYETSGWPVLIKNYNAPPGTNKIYGSLEYSINSSIHKTERFTALNVIAPVLSERFPKKQIPETGAGTTKPFNCFAFGWADKICSSFIFISCSLKQPFPIPTYYNELWPATIKSTFNLPDNDNLSFCCTCDKNRLVNLDDVLSTGAVIQNKVVFDTGKKIEDSITSFKKRRLFIAALKENTTHNTEYNNLNVEDFTSCFYYGLTYSEYMWHLYGNDFSLYKGSSSDSVSTLSLFHDKNLLRRKSFFQLGIAEEEYNDLIAELLPNADIDNVFFHLEELTFENSNFYVGERAKGSIKKFKLGLSYENNTGTIDTRFPINELNIYTMDGCYFFSNKYSDYQSFYTEFANAKVEFRPVSYDSYFDNSDPSNPQQIPVYNGEFGFDWLRIGDYYYLDTQRDNAAYDPPYSTIIESGYEKPNANDLNTEYESKKEAFKALKQEYFSLPASKRIVHFEDNYSDYEDYYVTPYLSLFSENFVCNRIRNLYLPYEANLRVLVEILEKLNKLEFEYNDYLFNITINNAANTTKNILSDKNVTPKKESEDRTIKITCLQDFAESQLIKVWAYPEGVTDKKEAKLAGVIYVNKNDVLTRKSIKFVYVKVKTNVDGATEATGNNTHVLDEKTNLQNALYHSLVMADIEDSPQELDLSDDPDFKTGGRFIDLASNGLNQDAPNFFQHLKNLFLTKRDSNENLINSKYAAGYFFIFVFGVDAYNTIAGQVEGIGVRNMLLFPSRNNRALAHEAMHGFGLRHTHRDDNTPINDPNQKYTFPKFNKNTMIIDEIYNRKATDNYMSYASSLRKTTWQWQQNIIRNNIK